MDAGRAVVCRQVNGTPRNILLLFALPAAWGILFVYTPAMNWIDFALVVVVLLAIWSGYNNGFILETIGILNWLGSLVVAFLFYQYTATLFLKIFPSLQLFRLPLAFLATAVIARLIIGIITRRIAVATSAYSDKGPVDAAMGVIPGFVNGAIFAAIIAAVLFAMPLTDGLNTTLRGSKVANFLAAKMETINEKLSPVFDKAIRQTLNDLTIHPASDETVKLPFKVAHPVVDSVLENKMIGLVNKERTSRGLPALVPDHQLTEVARAHSRDMFVQGYFSHITPQGKDPFDRMHEYHIRFLSAGENIALAQTLSIAHNGLMNSPGHRANILNPAFGQIGIGIMRGGMFGLMISQEFSN